MQRIARCLVSGRAQIMQRMQGGGRHSVERKKAPLKIIIDWKLSTLCDNGLCKIVKAAAVILGLFERVYNQAYSILRKGAAKSY